MTPEVLSGFALGTPNQADEQGATNEGRLATAVDTRVMLDPSLLLKPSALKKALTAIPPLIDRAGFEFFVAPSMVQPVQPNLDPEHGRLPDFFRTGPELVDLDEVTSRLAKRRGQCVGASDLG